MSSLTNVSLDSTCQFTFALYELGNVLTTATGNVAYEVFMENLPLKKYIGKVNDDDYYYYCKINN